MTKLDSVIEGLHDALGREAGLADVLEQSLTEAHRRAEADLDPELFEALDWPTDIGQYQDYIKRFLRWVPHQSFSDAWKNKRGHEQEVNDRTAHFFFLVDQKVDGEAPQDSPVFREWMTEFSRQWGSFLDTPESFNPEILESFTNRKSWLASTCGFTPSCSSRHQNRRVCESLKRVQFSIDWRRAPIPR